MAKKDYVLEKALKGDLDAVEHVLGGAMSPLFDLTYHCLNDTEESRNCLRQVLLKLAQTLIADGLKGSSPLSFGTQITVEILQTHEETGQTWQEYLSTLNSLDRLIFLVNQSLNIEGEALDCFFGLSAGEADVRFQSILADSKITVDAWRALLDEHASSAPLPDGLIDEVMDRVEELAEESE